MIVDGIQMILRRVRVGNSKDCGARVLAALVCLVAVAMLVGCAATSPVEIVTKILDDNGNVIKETTKTISDASIGKETIVHETLQNRDKTLGDAYEKEGMKLKWQLVKRTVQVGDNTVSWDEPMLVQAEHREPLRLNQPLPTQPSVHPVWAFGTETVKTLTNATLIGYLGGKAIDVFSDLSDRETMSFAGDANIDNIFSSGSGSTTSFTSTSNPVADLSSLIEQ